MLKQLRITKQLTEKRAELEKLEKRSHELEEERSGFSVREDELKAAVEEITAETPEEDRAAVDSAIDELEAQVTRNEEEQAEVDGQVATLREEITALDTELEELNAKVEKVRKAPANPTPEKRNTNPEYHFERGNEKMTIRSMLEKADREGQIFAREDVKAYLAEIRSAISEKRAITNAGILIPTVFLGVLRENIMNYSKLLRHVRLIRLGGNGVEVIQGTAPEGVWTECCATLNELTIAFNNVEVGCYKVGGYFVVCNALLEDADIDLAALLLDAIAQALGMALDKAILYGRNGNTTQKMPQGIVSRLVQTEAPSGYPATARTWVDLHTTNIISVPAASKGLALFQAIVTASGAAKGKYSRGTKVWVMNETTYTKLKAEAMSINAAGAIVSGMEGTMPVVGGVVEVLDFIPDNVVIGGYFDLYLLAERAGNKFASSEHARFIQDQTVLKGTARYDGAPAIAEGFVAIGLAGTTPTAAMTFASDTANA